MLHFGLEDIPVCSVVLRSGVLRPLVGAATCLMASALVAGATVAFTGGFADSVSVTVLSRRAGLVMNPGAKVELNDVKVGTVTSIDELVGGGAALHLAMDPAQLQAIPANIRANIASTTVFGAKLVQLEPPAQPSAQRLTRGQVIEASNVTVEVNTIFERLTALLSKIQPEKLNATLSAMSEALSGRGQRVGHAIDELDEALATIQPRMPELAHDLAVAPHVLKTYADTSGDLMRTARNTIRISETIVDQQNTLDALLLSATGLANVGNEVFSDNRMALAKVLKDLVPISGLTNRYNAALTCGLGGLLHTMPQDPQPVPGVMVLAGFTFGSERYRFPGDLPKVAAKGGPQCTDLPIVPYEAHPPWVVTDTGTNPWKYGNQSWVLNRDQTKQRLFGPIDGPPRNSAEIGHPG